MWYYPGSLYRAIRGMLPASASAIAKFPDNDIMRGGGAPSGYDPRIGTSPTGVMTGDIRGAQAIPLSPSYLPRALGISSVNAHASSAGVNTVVAHDGMHAPSLGSWIGW